MSCLGWAMIAAACAQGAAEPYWHREPGAMPTSRAIYECNEKQRQAPQTDLNRGGFDVRRRVFIACMHERGHYVLGRLNREEFRLLGALLKAEPGALADAPGRNAAPLVGQVYLAEKIRSAREKGYR